MDPHLCSGGFLSDNTHTKILLCDAKDMEEAEDPAEVLVNKEKVTKDKGKAKVCNDGEWEGGDEDVLASDLGNSASVAGSISSIYPLKRSTSLSTNSNNLNIPKSNLLSHNSGDCDEDYDDYADDISDYDDSDYFPYANDYLAMESQFDNVDLPPGVEASLPWLKDPTSAGNVMPGKVASNMIVPDGSETTMLDLNDRRGKPICANDSVLHGEPSSANKDKETGVMRKFQSFKRFDIVDDFSDHHYNNMASTEGRQAKEWAKRIQEEWRIMERDLPETIFVRVYEGRMDLLRAAIIGPSATPYHDGLFIFDCYFPPKYPNEPPMVYYYSGGLRLNPNLYECGKVCLSLLGTWHGEQMTEKWVPQQSTMLQVLVSVQALILNAKPFFNEPGYEISYVGSEGENRSRKYNENVFVLSLKTMIYTLRRPPKSFEDFVIGHFQSRAQDILAACQAYAEGATVGTVVIKEGVPDTKKVEMHGSNDFKTAVRKMMTMLVRVFNENGSTNCEQFKTSSG